MSNCALSTQPNPNLQNRWFIIIFIGEFRLSNRHGRPRRMLIWTFEGKKHRSDCEHVYVIRTSLVLSPDRSNRPFFVMTIMHTAYQNTLPDHSWVKLYVNIHDWSGGPLDRLQGVITQWVTIRVYCLKCALVPGWSPTCDCNPAQSFTFSTVPGGCGTLSFVDLPYWESPTQTMKFVLIWENCLTFKKTHFCRKALYKAACQFDWELFWKK